MRNAIIILFAALLSVGCEKVSVDCLYSVRATIQVTKDGADMRDPHVIGYAFFADTAQWRVMSADDAMNGVITNRKSGEKRNYDLRSEASWENEKMSFHLDRMPVILCVYEPLSESWAWRHAEIAENMPTASVVLKFRLWRWAESPFVENRWVINIPEQTPLP